MAKGFGGSVNDLPVFFPGASIPTAALDPAWASVAAWFIDPVNGRDSNLGTTPALALKTPDALSARLAGQTLTQDTTVTILGVGTVGVSIGTLDLHLDLGGFALTVVGTPAVSASGTFSALTAARAPATNTRWTVRDGAVVWTGRVAQLVRLTASQAYGVVLADAGGGSGFFSDFLELLGPFPYAAVDYAVVGNEAYATLDLPRIALAGVFTNGGHGGRVELKLLDVVPDTLDLATDAKRDKALTFTLCRWIDAVDVSDVCVTTIQSVFLDAVTVQAGGCLRQYNGVQFSGASGGMTVNPAGRLVARSITGGVESCYHQGCGLLCEGGAADLFAGLASFASPTVGLFADKGSAVYVQNSNPLWGSDAAAVGVSVAAFSGVIFKSTTEAGLATMTGVSGDFRCGQSATNMTAFFNQTTGAVINNIAQTWTLFNTNYAGAGFNRTCLNPANGAFIGLR